MYIFTKAERIYTVMEKNLLGEIRMMKDLKVTPNFSALGRKYQVDRHTAKKYYDNDGIPPRKKRKQSSKWDPYVTEIEELLKNPLVTYKAAYQYLKKKYGEDIIPGDYNSLRNYLLRKGYCKRQPQNVVFRQVENVGF